MTTTALQILDMPLPKAVEAIRSGIPSENFDAIAHLLALTSKQLADKLGVSICTTRNNCQKVERLSRETTEKLVRVARIHRLARILFATDASVTQWLSAPAPALHGLAPIDLLDTEVGARGVEAVIQGIAYGNVM